MYLMKGPIHHLNEELIGLIIPHLLVADLFACEGLSSTWQRSIQEWVPKHAVQLVEQQLRPGCNLPLQGRPVFSYLQIKEATAQGVRLESGRPSSLTSFEGTCPKTAGNFVAWIPKETSSDGAGVLNHGPANEHIYWKSLANGGSEVRVDTYKLGIHENPRNPQVGTSMELKGFMLNRDGILLLYTVCCDTKACRITILSPSRTQLVWYRASLGGCPEPVRAPLAVGKSLVYCATRGRHGPGYFLGAYKLQDGALAYQSRVLHPEWHRGYWNDGAVSSSRHKGDKLCELVDTGDDEEILLQRSTRETIDTKLIWRDHAIPTKLDIIRGRDGRLLRTISFQGCYIKRSIADSLTKGVALSWEILISPSPALGSIRLIFFRFLYRHGNRIDLSKILVVLDRGQDTIIDPFSMAAFGVNNQSECCLTRRTFSVITRPDVIDFVTHMVESCFPIERVGVWQCLATTGDEGAVMLPSATSPANSNMNMANPTPQSVEYAGNGRFGVELGMGFSVVDF